MRTTGPYLSWSFLTTKGEWQRISGVVVGGWEAGGCEKVGAWIRAQGMEEGVVNDGAQQAGTDLVKLELGLDIRG
jgi:hypothetical protein